MNKYTKFALFMLCFLAAIILVAFFAQGIL